MSNELEIAFRSGFEKESQAGKYLIPAAAGVAGLGAGGYLGSQYGRESAIEDMAEMKRQQRSDAMQEADAVKGPGIATPDSLETSRNMWERRIKNNLSNLEYEKPDAQSIEQGLEKEMPSNEERINRILSDAADKLDYSRDQLEFPQESLTETGFAKPTKHINTGRNNPHLYEYKIKTPDGIKRVQI